MQPVRTVSERTLLFLVGAVQFINVLEFMMVMPLGPDFAKALGISAAHLGVIGGSYTAAAAVSGIVASFFIERLDRRLALAGAVCGLMLATLAATFAFNLTTLLSARVMAGLFGGPAFSVVMAIVADNIPFERRGKAMGTVMGAFAAASVIGVPTGLELARIGGWRMPFFAVAGLGAVIAGYAIVKLPPLRAHIEAAARATEKRAGGLAGLWTTIKRPHAAASMMTGALLMLTGFMLFPNIAAYVQGNLHYPREKMGLLYFVGGTFSFVCSRLVGRFVDRYGAFAVSTVGSVAFASVVYFGFVHYVPAVPVLVFFTCFMLSTNIRNVPYMTQASQVPRPDERASFMSLQSSVQHMSSALGAFLSSELLSELPDHQLVGMDRVGWVSIGLVAFVPPLMLFVQRRVRADAAGRPPLGVAPMAAEH